MVVEYEYVFVNAENNELASPVVRVTMSSGEANYVNKTLEDYGSEMRYKLLSEDIPNDDNS